LPKHLTTHDIQRGSHPKAEVFTLNAIRENLQFSKSVPEIKAVSTTNERNGVMYWETQLRGPKYEQSIS
jgi:hypothetical protein